MEMHKKALNSGLQKEDHTSNFNLTGLLLGKKIEGKYIYFQDSIHHC